jgi:hypothetical protein
LPKKPFTVIIFSTRQAPKLKKQPKTSPEPKFGRVDRALIFVPEKRQKMPAKTNWCRGWDLNPQHHRDFSFPKENSRQKKGLYYSFPLLIPHLLL